MPSLPLISGTEAVRAFKIIGFTVARQRGSHIVMRKGSQGCVVPNHKEIKIGTLSGILKQAGVSVDDFIAALNA
jgi:predicted RNA binding protein YcfA (HicA-like mRNA interferase family)